MDKNTLSGILAAITASLCCIIPLLAFVAGVGGLASAFSWVVPIRPYLIGFTVVVLSLAWYKKLNPTKGIECNCESSKENSFLQSKKFLALVTLFAVLMTSFPYYSKIFYPILPPRTVVVQAQNIINKEFTVIGMTCRGCEENVKQVLNELENHKCESEL